MASLMKRLFTGLYLQLIIYFFHFFYCQLQMLSGYYNAFPKIVFNTTSLMSKTTNKHYKSLLSAAIFYVAIIFGSIYQSNSIYLRGDWIYSLKITAFTVCGFEIGPVYASNLDGDNDSEIHLWTFDKTKVFGYIQQLVCSKYAKVNQSSYLAALVNIGMQKKQILVFKVIEEQEETLGLDLLPFSIDSRNPKQFMLSHIALEGDTISVLFQTLLVDGKFSSKTSQIQIYKIKDEIDYSFDSQFEVPFKVLGLEDSKCSLLLDDNKNLGVYCPSRDIFTFYHQPCYNQKDIVEINKSQKCDDPKIDFYTKFTRMIYREVQINQDDENEEEEQKDYQTIFYLYFENSFWTCNIEVEIQIAIDDEKNKNVLINVEEMQENANYICDGRNFFYQPFQNSIDESQIPLVYPDITIKQPIVNAFCVNIPSTGWFPNNVRFYILSKNETLNYYFIDIYNEHHVLIYVGIGAVVLILIIFGTILAKEKRLGNIVNKFLWYPDENNIQQLMQTLQS